MQNVLKHVPVHLTGKHRNFLAVLLIYWLIALAGLNFCFFLVCGSYYTTLSYENGQVDVWR